MRARWMVAGLLLGGCAAPRPQLVVTDPDPSVKVPAMKLAVHRQDRSVAEPLVRDLESDDPAVRFYAIEALRRLTGDDLGYRYYDPEPQRRVAVDRWRAAMKQDG